MSIFWYFKEGKNPNLTESEQAITVLTRLEAIDTDSGEFGQIRYSIVEEKGKGKSPFWIDPESGVLALIGELDREEKDRWEVEVRAEDGGGLQGGMRVQVRVQDENDNAPECTQPLVQAQLLENDPNGLDLHLEATDRDQHRHPGGFLFKLPPDTPPELARALRVSSNGRIQLVPDTSLDFEQWTKKAKRSGPAALIEFGVEVHDRGEPVSLKGICRVQIVLLDMNDNAPIFERPLYEVEIRENAPQGTKILQLLATDLDSEHFGHVSYSMESAQLIQLKENNQTELMGSMLNQTELSEYFTLGDQDGWLKIAAPLDFEQIGENRLIQLRILALDGGDPPLSGHTLVQLRVLDQNDNPPRVSDCANLNALVQEGVAPGNSLLSLAISDADSASFGNAGPFRVQLSGLGADAFAIDPMLNVITTRQLVFAQNREFHLELRAYDAGGLPSNPCPLRVRIQPQSRHAPTVHPLSIQLMALHGEYLGGPLGKLAASDRDPSDQLRFSIVSDSRPHSPPQFSVNSDTGDLFASGDLLPGLHLFNVSVTDGKFVTTAPISVNVVKVDQEKLDNSLSIRIRGVGIELFVHKYMSRFVELLARLLAVRPTNVYILAMQEIQQQQQSSQIISKTSKELGNGSIRRRRRHRRPKRSSPIQKQGMAPKETTNSATIDILLTIQRPEGTMGGGAMYHRPSYVKQRLEAGIGPLFAREAPELEILSMITEVCRRDTCPRGECRDRLWLDNAKLQTFQFNGSTAAFVGPMHVRTFECICRQGYAGANCDVPVNKCSKELCRRVEMCIPSSPSSSSSPSDSANNVGFNCACPPGFRGPTCSDRICANHPPATLTECQRQHEAISLLGNGYFELHLTASVESRMELSVEFRTISSRAVLMHGAGLHDHHTLRIVDGMIQYVWDCGTGEGTVRVSGTRVDDGLWHQIRVLRIGRLSRLTLDDKYRAEGTSPAGSDVLNLFQHSALLVFGARVSPSPQSLAQFADSFIATNSPRGNNKLLTADELREQIGEGMVGCIGRVAMDGGTAPQGSKMAAGLGALRLFGATIGCDERALGPCLNAPCQNGGQCVPGAPSDSAMSSLAPNESSAFTCSCPPRFTGARCEIDLNACAAHPCPNGIPCHNLYGDFHCSCPAGFTGKTCQLRGDWDPCMTASCGPNGQCVRLPGNSFSCLCAPGFSGPQCSDPSPTELTDPRGTDSDGSIDWLSDLIRSPQFALLLVVCVLSLLCTVLAIFICRRRSSRVNQRNGWRNRAKAKGKVATNGGTGSVGSRNRNGTGTGSGSGTRNPNRNGGRREDPACSLLVPKETAAPGQGTADRPPPPLPPRYHRRNANGHSSALPTVEVRPMPAKKENVSKQLDEKKKSEKATKQNPPVPPPRDSSSSADQQTCSNSNDAALRAFGRFLEPDELRRYNLNGEGGTNKEEEGQKSTMDVVEQQAQPKGSYGRKIERACSVAANTQKQKVTAKKAPPEQSKAKEGEDNYLTMKPVHRAKPFSRLARDEGESAPPPPMHRTPLLNARGRNPGTSSTKMYESPVDALDDRDGEAGGGVTQ